MYNEVSMTKEILLTNGAISIVDDDDYAMLSQHTWTQNNNGYALTVINQKTVLMHRFLTGATKGVEVDHKDGNRLNNTRANLRFCTRVENTRNRQKIQNSKSKYKGVTQDRTRSNWRAAIGISRKTIYLGVFATEEEAARAYDAAVRERYGEFAYLNFPNETK